MDDTRYYAFQSRWSEPAEFAPLLAPLSAGAPAVVEAVAGLVLHPVLVARRGVTPHAGSGDDAESRTVRELLRRVLARDGRPLAAARAPERRFIGTCRDYALLVCSVLRHQGIPARLRVGFADYFVPGFHEDHWLCEYRHLAPGSGVPDAVAARLDALAAVVAAEPPDRAAVRAAYDGDEAVRVPAVVRSFPRGGPLDVDLTAM